MVRTCPRGEDGSSPVAGLAFKTRVFCFFAAYARGKAWENEELNTLLTGEKV